MTKRKPKESKTYHIRLPAETAAKLEALAKLQGRPTANLAAHLLTLSLSKEQK